MHAPAAVPTILAAAAVLACVGGLASAATVGDGADPCPSLAQFRTSAVAASFDAAKLDGFWYEQQFVDIAQLGASCPTLNSTLNVTTGEMDMAFAVKYGPLPFTIIESYVPTNASIERALYTKHAKMPFGNLLQLPTVVVDVTPSADGSSYDTMTLYSCLPALGKKVEELVLATRARTPDPSMLTTMRNTITKQAVPVNVSALAQVDWAKCASE
mmetsp:Transcript_12639/g.29858  ORF Transcript_12639/g.29858 Transcript_12639/m.29858 type:complete len:214 (+) Transcript_12639:161-802(+)